MLFLLRGIFFALALLKICSSTSLKNEGVMKRLCRSDYVFKFQVISDIQMECLKSPVKIKKLSPTKILSVMSSSTKALSLQLPSILATTSLPSSIVKATKSLNNRSNLTLPNSRLPISMTTLSSTSTSSQHSPITLPISTLPTLANQLKPPQGLHKQCQHVPYQTVRIQKQEIYKGERYLQQIDVIKVFPEKQYYEGRLRPDWFFQNLLKLNHDYLFMGRQIKNLQVKDNIFMSNPSNVEKWTEELKLKIGTIDFTKDC